MTARIPPLSALDPARFETAPILKRLAAASRQLAELKGVASIPNQAILINTVGIQEAKDSSAIENIVTTHDEIFRDEAFPDFYDGNGRTGRILNVLYLVKEGLLDTPVLYMSRHIVRTKSQYYQLLQAVRNEDAWEAWVLYVLTAVEETAREGIATVAAIKTALLDVKHRVRERYRFYSRDLINNIFSHPYTKIRFVERELGVSRITATRYLDELSAGGILRKVKVGRSNFYINVALYAILAGEAASSAAERAV